MIISSKSGSRALVGRWVAGWLSSAVHVLQVDYKAILCILYMHGDTKEDVFVEYTCTIPPSSSC